MKSSSKIAEELRLISVGRIVRTHGLRGFVKISPYGETLDAVKPGDKLFLRSASKAAGNILTLVDLKPHGNVWLAHFEELTTVEEAQAVVGEEVFVPEDRLPPTSEGEYYHYQLIGLMVETVDGKKVGVLSDIMEIGSHDVYVVKHEGREALIPAVDQFIRVIDLERGVMVVDPPEGLIDDL